MLAAYLDIKPAPDSTVVSHVITPEEPPGLPAQTAKIPKALKPAKPSAPRKRKSQTKAPPVVEPYEGGSLHARFQPAKETEPKAVVPACVLECDAVGPADGSEAGDETSDPYEYLCHDADRVATEDEDSDSCQTFDDDVSDVSETTETFSTSPSEAFMDGMDKVFFSKRKAKVSEISVYAGPELWYEDDDFIE